jgi:hypothetical protein
LVVLDVDADGSGVEQLQRRQRVAQAVGDEVGAVEVDPGRRAETLTLQEWAAVYRGLRDED